MKDAVTWISNRFVELYPADAAREAERRPIAETATLLVELPPKQSAAVLSRMHPAGAADCLQRMEKNAVGPLLDQVPPDVAARIMRHAGATAAERFLEGVSPTMANAIRRLAQYAPGSIGAVVELNNPALPTDTTVTDARKAMRASPSPYLYVIDRDHRLVGVIGATLWSARTEQTLRDVLQPNVVRLNAKVETSAVISHPAWAEYDPLPVVDGQDRFLGVVRHKTLRRLLGARATAAGDDAVVATLLRLAELYWVGVTATLSSLRLGPPPLRHADATTDKGVRDGTR